jgi:hypothetical protein
MNNESKMIEPPTTHDLNVPETLVMWLKAAKRQAN